MRSFIWTEAIGCVEILRPMLESFCAHHNNPIHVYIYEKDLESIKPLLNENIRAITIPKDVDSNKPNEFQLTESELLDAYKGGHGGTAILWSHIIKSRDEEVLIHLDSDTIFVGEVISQIKSKMHLGYAIVGSRRPYRKNVDIKNFRFYLRFLMRPDAINTHCFGFRRDLIAKFNIKELDLLIRGKYRSKLKRLLFPVIDFFDELTFFLRNKGGIYYLDAENQSRSGIHNREGKFESSLIVFSAVGSGCALYQYKDINTSDSYQEFALRSFSLFSKLLLDKELDIPPLKSPYLEKKVSQLDRNSWRLRL